MKMHLPKEFYCWTVARGMIIYGTFAMVIHSIGLCNSIYVYSSRVENKTNTSQGSEHTISIGHTVFYFITWSALEIIVNALLIRGIMKKIWKMLIPWLVVYALILIQIALANLIFYISVVPAVPFTKAEVFEMIFAAEVVFLIIFVYIGYPFISVLGLYRRFKSGSQSRVDQELMNSGKEAEESV